MIKILKYINSLPFPVTVKHYVSFGVADPYLENIHGEKDAVRRWQILRDKHPRYRIPKDRETWLKDLSLRKDGQDDKLPERVEALATLIEKEGIRTFYSVGSGGGVFEYFLKKRIPSLKIVASEYTQEGVERLRSVFLECDKVNFFDALNDISWVNIGADKNSIVFIYRNEREFSDKQWRQIFRAMHKAGVKRVFLGLMNMLTFLAFAQEKIRNLKHRFRGEKLNFVGFLRSRYTFRSFWKGLYTDTEIYFPNCRGIYLKRI
ncbi:MAG: hypothetical protein U1D31_01235 [Patescibacteria group bacterium]|nr:hypothetical protein [bacterium]MDZ4240739.1 hypothetical protein [Patescibacteria group bacterium]